MELPPNHKLITQAKKMKVKIKQTVDEIKMFEAIELFMNHGNGMMLVTDVNVIKVLSRQFCSKFEEYLFLFTFFQVFLLLIKIFKKTNLGFKLLLLLDKIPMPKDQDMNVRRREIIFLTGIQLLGLTLLCLLITQVGASK